MLLKKPCSTCGSFGFLTSVLGPDRCTYCDGTEGGNPPTEQDIEDARWLQSNTETKSKD